jgi:hypothetical protein
MPLFDDLSVHATGQVTYRASPRLRTGNYGKSAKAIAYLTPLELTERTIKEIRSGALKYAPIAIGYIRFICTDKELRGFAVKEKRTDHIHALHFSSLT